MLYFSSRNSSFNSFPHLWINKIHHGYYLINPIINSYCYHHNTNPSDFSVDFVPGPLFRVLFELKASYAEKGEYLRVLRWDGVVTQIFHKDPGQNQALTQIMLNIFDLLGASKIGCGLDWDGNNKKVLIAGYGNVIVKCFT